MWFHRYCSQLKCSSLGQKASSSIFPFSSPPELPQMSPRGMEPSRSLCLKQQLPLLSVLLLCFIFLLSGSLSDFHVESGIENVNEA